MGGKDSLNFYLSSTTTLSGEKAMWLNDNDNFWPAKVESSKGLCFGEWWTKWMVAQLAGVVEYIDCISAEG